MKDLNSVIMPKQNSSLSLVYQPILSHWKWATKSNSTYTEAPTMKHFPTCVFNSHPNPRGRAAAASVASRGNSQRAVSRRGDAINTKSENSQPAPRKTKRLPYTSPTTVSASGAREQSYLLCANLVVGLVRWKERHTVDRVGAIRAVSCERAFVGLTRGSTYRGRCGLNSFFGYRVQNYGDFFLSVFWSSFGLLNELDQRSGY